MIQFYEFNGTNSGVGANGRVWRITRTAVGWRLEFQDPGDATATRAGLYGSFSAAQKEASWESGRRTLAQRRASAPPPGAETRFRPRRLE
jgi:hypothetical protein